MYRQLQSGRVTGKLRRRQYGKTIRVFSDPVCVCVCVCVCVWISGCVKAVRKSQLNTPSGLRCDKHFIKQYCVTRLSSMPSIDTHFVLARN